MEYKYWSNQDLALIKKDFENEIAKDIAAGRNWQMRVYRSPSGWSSDAVFQDKIIEMMENGQLPKVKIEYINKGKSTIERAADIRQKVKTI